MLDQITTETTTTSGWWDGTSTMYPYQPYIYTTPSFCQGNVHVWACDHAKSCRCGEVSRKVKCPHCGKGATHV